MTKTTVTRIAPSVYRPNAPAQAKLAHPPVYPGTGAVLPKLLQPLGAPQHMLQPSRLAGPTSHNFVQPMKKTAPAPPVYRPTNDMAVSIQRMGTTIGAVVVQMKGSNPCLVCGHKHGSSVCKKLKDGKLCGCKSHSGHWDKGSTVNPGSGKRDRMIAAQIK